MKKIIYTILSITMLTACKKETTQANNNTSNTTSSIAKYGNGVTDIDGNKYKTAIIGKQEWMAENLKVSKYNDGTIIPNITDKTKEQGDTTGAWSYYNNDSTYNSKYGKLYNWFAVSPTTNGNKNVCPTGWHVPTNDEWTVLTDYLGGENVSGGKMREVGTLNWNTPNTDATNESLFSALPGGLRYFDGIYAYIGRHGYWWSSTVYNKSSAWLLVMNHDDSYAFKRQDLKLNGYSIRCIKD
jgi:uncharacterized protein (TIGR02145 family)